MTNRRPFRDWVTIDMDMLQPQERLTPRTDARKLSRPSSVKHRQAYKRHQRDKAGWTICKIGLDRVTRCTDIDIRAPSDLLWGVRSRGYGQLLGGALQLPSRAHPWSAHGDADTACFPPVHPDEDLYLLNVLRAPSCDESKND